MMREVLSRRFKRLLAEAPRAEGADGMITPEARIASVEAAPLSPLGRGTG